jgi:phosphoribosylformimino-5-aminoimidazole carboxamide ribotide isomerase
MSTTTFPSCKHSTRIRPCIDLHQGQVKQIVGSSLSSDDPSSTSTQVNFTSDQPPSYFAKLYRDANLTGGHVILLGPGNDDAAKNALATWPEGLQVGGGVTDENCVDWIQAGAAQVIVTSYVFCDGIIHWGRLQTLLEKLGSEDKLVLDLSCRKKEDGKYYVVTNRWQTFTDTVVDADLLQKLALYCCEFLIHAVDVEGKQSGIQEDIVMFLGEHCPEGIAATYAGGVRSLDDLDLVERLGRGRVDVTVGSALDIFGGPLPFKDVVEWHTTRNLSVER